MKTQSPFLKAVLCLFVLLSSHGLVWAQLPPNFNPQIQLPEFTEGPYCAGTVFSVNAPFTGFLPNQSLVFFVGGKLEGSVTTPITATIAGASDAFGNGVINGSVFVPNVPGGTYLVSLSTTINFPQPVGPILIETPGVPVIINNPPAPNLTNQAVAQNSALTLTTTNCLGTVNWTGPGETSGTGAIPVNTSQVGQLTYSASCTEGPCTGPTTTVTITVTAESQPFALIAPTYDCATGAFRFNTQGGTGELIEYYSVPGITDWSTNPNQFVDVETRTTPDAPIIILRARQSGVEVTYEWNIRAVCPLGGEFPPNQSPGVLLPIPNQTATKGQFFSYTFPDITFRDPDGDALTFTIAGQPAGLNLSGSTLSGTTDQTGEFPVTITATDPKGLSASSTFVLKVNLTDQPLTLLAPTYDCGTGAFRFNIQEGTGDPVEYMAIGITGWTTNPDQFVDEGLRTAADAPIITLKARQNGVEVTYDWNIRAVCPLGSGRLAAAELSPELNVRILGNPVHDRIGVEVSGAEGQPLQVELLTTQGNVVTLQQRTSAAAAEQISLDVNDQPEGILLVRVSTPTKGKTIRVLKR